MDAVTLDHLLAEIVPLVVGRHLGRPRIVGPHAVAFEVMSDRERWLWLDAARGTAGIYRLGRDEARRIEGLSGGEAPGRTRQAHLLLRKHVDGSRVLAVTRVPGERTLVIETGGGTLCLRLSGPAPALTLAKDGGALATIGEGPEAWPLPAPAPQKEWDRVEPEAITAAVVAAGETGRAAIRAILGVCPGIGPLLARELDGSPGSLTALRARLAVPLATLRAPGPPDAWHDADLVLADAVALLPIPIAREGATVLHPATWTAAAALFLAARRRGAHFERRRRDALGEARRQVRRLGQLEANLEHDGSGLPKEADLRRRAEALLAFAQRAPPGAATVELPDPYEPDRVLSLTLDPRLSAPANADRLFDRARRIERSRLQIAGRLRDTRAARAAARAQESAVLDARDAADLEPHRAEGQATSGREPGPAGPRHYLTSRGLSILVGRGARENHHLTFEVARPEDLWLHARDVPGAHVIIRDPEGRAGADDLREAAEVAAFLSEAHGEAQVDVHVTRRKHLRPARGGPGRVYVGHSDTLRAVPRDPEGRLRRR
jgi:fibronectin-binding protein A (FbpA)/ribosomal quality control pathway NFACT family protein